MKRWKDFEVVRAHFQAEAITITNSKYSNNIKSYVAVNNCKIFFLNF